MFIKATVDIAEANNMNNQNMNQQPMLGGGGETVVVEDARMEPMMGGYWGNQVWYQWTSIPDIFKRSFIINSLLL